MTPPGHWDEVYANKGDQTSWFQPTLQRSLSIVDGLGIPKGATAIDVGAGRSTLVDDLLERGFSHVTVADLSEVALEATRTRLGDAAKRATFVVGDITQVELPEAAFDLWHDRAVFHFLTDERARTAYVRQVIRALKPGGHIIVATFGPDGPEKCSGLPVVRYDEQSLHATFGTQSFHKLGCEHESHTTPWGSVQEFTYCYCRLDEPTPG